MYSSGVQYSSSSQKHFGAHDDKKDSNIKVKILDLFIEVQLESGIVLVLQ